jgi:ClpX C4-type zinc finger protein
MTKPVMRARPLPGTAEWKQLHCSFCGQDADHVRFLTAGTSGGMICDVCCVKAFWIFLRAHARAALFVVRQCS